MKKELIIKLSLLAIIIIIIINNTNATKTTKTINYQGKNLLVNIDGAYSNKIPTTGKYYLISYTCSNTKTKVSWDSNNHTLSFTNGTSSSGISCNLNFSEDYLLTDATIGSYVKYCTDNTCQSTTANNEYCTNQTTQNNYQLAYIYQNHPYLITTEPVSCNQSQNIDLNSYCNQDLIFNKTCTNDTIHPLTENDFTNITSSNIEECLNKSNNKNCGYSNKIIDTNNYYSIISSDNSNNYYWDQTKKIITTANDNKTTSPRIIIKLSSQVSIISGTGTITDPYIITKKTSQTKETTNTITTTKEEG